MPNDHSKMNSYTEDYQSIMECIHRLEEIEIESDRIRDALGVPISRMTRQDLSKLEAFSARLKDLRHLRG